MCGDREIHPFFSVYGRTLRSAHLAMPGVPSGLGCDACRKQKKKASSHDLHLIARVANLEQCNLANPACSRCARLRIQCIGAGERRFKFKDQTVVMRPSKHAGKLVQQRTAVSTRKLEFDQSDDALSFVPYSETMRIANAFISTLEISDLRYAVSYYGAFLKYVPQRLGINQALDASVLALAGASSCIRTRQNSTQVLVQYGDALKALRLCLSDPVKAQSPETLCAIYLVMICQVSFDVLQIRKTNTDSARRVG